MPNLNNILFVCHGLGKEEEGLKQALLLAHTNQAKLTILIVYPTLPASFKDYKSSYEQSIIDQLEQTIKSAKTAINMNRKKFDIPIVLECGATPAVRIIQYILKNAHDLLIKQAENSPNQIGFKSLDMALLRKCPCPMLMVRPAKHIEKEIRIAVAIDPKAEESAGRALSLELLKYASSLAHHFSGQLDIVSCWLFRQEQYLRDGIWITVSDDEIDQMVLNEKNEHENALRSIIKESEIDAHYQIQLPKGLAEDAIPAFVESHEIDILVMGTVARTGISSFIIGNTAENILQKINCSLLALKPQGFVSPVKAY